MKRQEITELVADALLGRDEWEPCIECDRPVDPRDEVLLGSTVYCKKCFQRFRSYIASSRSREK